MKKQGKAGAAAPERSDFDRRLLESFDLPDKCPKLTDSQKERMEDKYDDLLEIYNEIKSLYGELDALQNEEDERELRRNQGKIRKTEGRIRRAKAALVRKVRLRYRPLQKKLKDHEELKRQYEERLAAAERSGSKRMVKKLTGDYEDRARDLEKYQDRMAALQYLLFWNFSKGGKK